MALGLRNNDKRRVMLANRDFDGPIRPGTTGKKPRHVERETLIAWWNGLAENHEAKATSRSPRLEQHSYGRSGTVVPEINGEVKNRRVKK